MDVPEPGQTFEERYEIQEVLGSGGFARVFRARDLSVGREVALKVLWPSEGSYDPAVAARFMREARVVAELQDPHTITLYDYGERSDGLLWMACEFVAGRDLAEVLRDERKLDPAITMHVVRQLASSLREAHGRGVLHRDIKPANILVHEYAGDPYSVKLIDFGLAKSWSSTATQITAAGRITGTPRYMSPEQLFGGRLDPRTDIYSLGLVVFEMLVGRPAVEGATTEELIREQAGGAPILVPRDAAPEALCALVEQMVQRDTRLRPMDIEHVEQAVRTIIRSGRTRPAAAPSSPAAETAADDTLVHHPQRSRPGPAVRPQIEVDTPGIPRWVPGVAVGVLVVLGGLLAWSQRADEPPQAVPVERRVDALVVAEDEPPPAAPVAVNAGESAQCEGLKAFTTGVHTLTSLRGLNRTEQLVYIPPDYDPKKKHPVIWFFHDYAEAPQTVLQALNYGSAEGLPSFVIVAPKSGMSAWGMVADLDDAVETLEVAHETLCLDRERFFIWGHGLGGRVATRRGLCMPGVTAVATTNYRERFMPTLCEPVAGRPYLHVGVLDDPVSPAKGGQGCHDYVISLGACPDRTDRDCVVTPSISEHEAFFAKRAGCTGEKRAADAVSHSRCQTWTCESPFVSCITPGGRPLPRVAQKSSTCQSSAADFPYVRTVYEFFSRYDSGADSAP